MTNLISVKATRNFGKHTAGDELLLDGADREVQRHIKSGLLQRTPDNDPTPKEPPVREIPPSIVAVKAKSAVVPEASPVKERPPKVKPKPTKPSTKPSKSKAKK